MGLARRWDRLAEAQVWTQSRCLSRARISVRWREYGSDSPSARKRERLCIVSFLGMRADSRQLRTLYLRRWTIVVSVSAGSGVGSP
jgi:hypothetical protein